MYAYSFILTIPIKNKLRTFGKSIQIVKSITITKWFEKYFSERTGK